ncbi:MAG: polysaccharide deacetylase family protein [Spirochaetota bacterium]
MARTANKKRKKKGSRGTLPVDETIARIKAEEQRSKHDASSANLDEERDLLEAKEIFALSKVEIEETPVSRVGKRVRRIILISLPAIGALSILFYLFVLPNLFRASVDTIQDLSKKVDDDKQKIAVLRDNEEIQKNLLFDYKIQFDRYRIRARKESIANIRDMNMGEMVERNLLRFTSGITNAGRNVFRGTTRLKRIAITFDLGTGTDAGRLYAILKKYGVVATVFISNETPRKNAGSLLRGANLRYIKLLSDLGCEFGNHTWSHFELVRSLYETSYKERVLHNDYSTYPLSREEFAAQLKQVEDTFRKVTGKELAKIWRAPYGSVDQDILNVAASLGYPVHVYWTVDFLDYVSGATTVSYNADRAEAVTVRNSNYYTSKQMLSRLIAMENYDPMRMNGVITLCHLGSAREYDKMIDIVPRFIEHYRKRGYKFVTVTEILGDGPKEYEHLK